MSQAKEFKYDKTRVKVYGGLNEIGGNCLVIEDGDRKIIFDNGIRFSLLRRLYGGRIEPLGPAELRSVGAIPPLETFQDAQALYISHLHLDHVGLLGSVPPELTIKIPGQRVLENTLIRWYKTRENWLAYIPPSDTEKVEEIKPYEEDKNGVVAIQVSHSCFPSYSFLYLGSERIIFYSGDFRLEPLSPGLCRRLVDVLREINIEHVDVAILEGTNFGEAQTLITPSAFKEGISSLLREHTLVSISMDPLDLETFLAVLDLSLMLNRNVAVGSSRLFWILHELEEMRPESLDYISTICELETPPPMPLRSVSLKDEVLRNPEDYTLIMEPVELLLTLRKLRTEERKHDLIGSVVVLMDPERRESLREVEERVLRTWLKAFGVQIVKLRLSGHYSPYQFRNIIEILRPKQIIPVHTKEARLMQTLFQRFTRAK